MNLQVMLLMAGRGSRFRAVGHTESKALIAVQGSPMFERALDGLEPASPFDLTVVVREDQVALEGIDRLVLAARPDARIVRLPTMTRGAAESAAQAAAALDPDRPLVVLDCDLFFSSSTYVELIGAAARGELDAGLLTFQASDSRYSYARVDDDGNVVEVAEKRVISDRAIAGAYLFSSVRLFAEAAEQVMRQDLDAHLPEYFMSAVVQRLVQHGARVRTATVDRYSSFGTPEELLVSEADFA